MYRKVPRDLTKGSVSGGWLSIVAILSMSVLFVLELNAYLTTNIVTSIVMDEGESDLLPINFNLTFPRLSCQHASVDVSNVMGINQVNITRNIRKFVINGHTGRVLKEVADVADVPAVEELKPEQIDKYKDANHASAITTTIEFNKIMSEHKLVMINFYAPWCFWSNKLRPTWEYLAEITTTQSFYDNGIKIVKVDCTDKTAHDQLCHSNHINAFPTIIVYRSGGTHSHEHYHGDRTSAAFLKYMRTAMSEVGIRPGMPPARSLKKKVDENAPLVIKNAGPEGCNIVGRVDVSKVPGNFHVSADAHGYSFDAARMNVSHVVHHLSFGDILDKLIIASNVPEEFWAGNRLDGIEVTSSAQNATHEHYIKIVANQYQMMANDDPVTTYKYTFNSNSYHHVGEDGADLPEARFTYDISPMAVKLTETRKPLYHFITNVCAIIGGLFTVLGLLDSIVYHGMNSLKKKVELGKAS